MAFSDWSTTSANNTNASTGVNWDENMPPSTVNDSGREMMAQLKDAVVDKTSAQTLTNKTLTSPVITDATIDVASGVKFPATQSASADVNTLDDYEEGTWTAGLSFGGGTTGLTYSGRDGIYVKIGSLVFVSFSIAINAKGSSTGNALVTGLPFTIKNATASFGSCGVAFWQDMASSFVYVSLACDANTTTMIPLGLTAAATGLTQLTDADFANSAVFRGSAVYQAS